MDIKRFETGPRMSQAVVHNGTVYLAGQVGEAGSDVTEQTKQALAEVDRLLALAGTDKTRILSTQIWLADMADFSKMNAVWDGWAPQATPRPAPPANPSWRRPTISSRSSSSLRSEPASDKTQKGRGFSAAFLREPVRFRRRFSASPPRSGAARRESAGALRAPVPGRSPAPCRDC